MTWFLAPMIGHAATCTQGLLGSYAMFVIGSNTADNSAKYLAGAVSFSSGAALSASNVYVSSGNCNNGNCFYSIVPSAASGSYSFNTDCTITITLNVTVNGSAVAQSYTVALANNGNEAVGIETDTSGVATIDLQAQFPNGGVATTFGQSSANGLFTGACSGNALFTSDLNVVTFANGSISGTDPYNDYQPGGGDYQTANNPYSGTYTVNADGSFSGTLTVDGSNFNYYGVIANSGAEVEYFYTAIIGTSTSTAFESCVDKL
jgi:hypothetical protein